MKNCRVHPTHWLIYAQATVTEGIPPECVLAFEAVTKDGSKLKEFPACIDNLVVVTEAVINKPDSFADAGATAQDSIPIQMIAKYKKPDTVLPPFDDEEVIFKSSDVFALPAVTKNGLDLEKYPESMDNLIVVMQAVLQNKNAFQFAGCHAQSDLLIQLVATGLGRRPHDAVASFAEMAESRFPLFLTMLDLTPLTSRMWLRDCPVLPRGQDGRQLAPGSSFSEVSPATTLPSRCLANVRPTGQPPPSLEALSLPRVRS